jgi:hypothetical protein
VRTGFSSDSSLLYHVNIPSAIVDATPWQPPDTSDRAETIRCRPRPLQDSRPLFGDEAWKDADVVTGRRLRARQRRRCDCPMWIAGTESALYPQTRSAR